MFGEYNKNSSTNVTGGQKSLKGMFIKKPKSDASKFHMISQGLHHAMHPDKIGVFDELKKHGLLNTASIAKKFALLMDE